MGSVHGTGVWSDAQMLTVTVASAASWIEGWGPFGRAAVPCLALADTSCSEAGAAIGSAVIGAVVGAAVRAAVGATVAAAVYAPEATLLISCADSRGWAACCAMTGVRRIGFLDCCLSFLACLAAALAAALADKLAYRCTRFCKDVCAGMTPEWHSSAAHMNRTTES